MIRELLNKSATTLIMWLVAAYLILVFAVALVVALPFGVVAWVAIWMKRELLGPREYWTPWFAWRPVAVNGKLVWLKKLDRRMAIDKKGVFTHVEYRTYPENPWEFTEGTFEDVH